MSTSIRLDPRTPVRTVRLGQIEANLYETKSGRRVELAVDGSGMVTLYPHEFGRVRLLLDLIERGLEDEAARLALETEGDAA